MGAGESYEENAVREVEEEMGVKGVPLVPLFKFSFEDNVTRLWGKAFRCVYSGPMILQARNPSNGCYPHAKQCLCWSCSPRPATR